MAMNNTSPRQTIIQEVRMMLGGGMVNVELTPAQLELALNLAFERYRTRSSNSVVERYSFLQLQPEQNIYKLPDDVQHVHSIHRRGVAGTSTGGGAQLDPFALAYTNGNLMQNGREGGLLTYELFAGFQEMVARMFGLFITHDWNESTKEMKIHRYVRSPEDVLLWLYCYKTDDELLKDYKARQWIRDYTAARCKIFLGEIRGKFSQFAGPQGGASLNGDSLKQEGTADLERLEAEIQNYLDSDQGYGFLFG